ncbi:MAG TPA: Ppx/GppA phosphatase family protein [Tepidisphaeraceae bacterium]|nr:Ppx/GppA phosphatase family protein [Tepidisphaeraceae bacterium]
MTQAPSTLVRPSSSTGGGSPSELRIAAIDVGSNSLHMVIAQADSDGSITTLWRMKEMVGLGRMSFPSRRLSREAIDRAVATLSRFVQSARQRGCEKILAVATSAVREATNGGDFLLRCRREVGSPVRVISARDEAKFIYYGVRHAIDLGDQPRLIIDVGGGSVEFIVGDASRPLMLESRKLGAARMTAKYVHSDPISSADLKSLTNAYDRELTPLSAQILSYKPVSVIGTSGTLENLAAMCASIGKNGNGAEGIIERGPLSKLVTRLIESRAKDRAGLEGLDDQRKDQIVAGALLVHELMRRLDVDRIKVCRSALREGILVDYISRHLPDIQVRREVPDTRRRSVLDLARRAAWHQSHSEQVARLALELFDQLQPLHKLGPDDRELIEFGALLHDIGWHIDRRGHHKHAMYLIDNGGLKNFTREEIAIIANIARYHRKSAPKMKHEPYAALSSRARNVVMVGAALLRIADGLDRSHGSMVSSVTTKIGKKRVDVTIKARGDIELELWGARRKLDLFTQVFGRKLRFKKS